MIDVIVLKNNNSLLMIKKKKALYRIQEHKKKNISDIKNNHNSPCYENMLKIVLEKHKAKLNI